MARPVRALLANALGERLTYGEAVSHVSFTLHHDATALPISDACSVAIERSGRQVALENEISSFWGPDSVFDREASGVVHRFWSAGPQPR